jgi:hypothetical protein
VFAFLEEKLWQVGLSNCSCMAIEMVQGMRRDSIDGLVEAETAAAAAAGEHFH